MGKEDESDSSKTTSLQHVLIKWTGGKRRQARRIFEHFLRQIATYHEPFLGGGAVLYDPRSGRGARSPSCSSTSPRRCP